MKATGGEGVDLIVDQVSGELANRESRRGQDQGPHRQCRPARRHQWRIRFRHACRTRIDYIGVTFRTRTIEEVREIFNEVRSDIWPAVESRKLQVPIDRVFTFDDIGKAFEHMEANEHLGKIAATRAFVL